MGVESGSGGPGGAMDVDQSGSGVDGGVGVVSQGGEVRGGAEVGRNGDLQSSSEGEHDELTSSPSEAESGVILSTRKRKTPPPPEPASKGGKRRAPKKKPVRKPPPKAKPGPKPELKLQSQPPQSQKASTRTYFEEVETKGPQGSQLKIVEIIDLTQVWVCPFFPAWPFSLLICLVERASKTNFCKRTGGKALRCVVSRT